MLKYIQARGAIIGIPARNLSNEEVKKYGGKEFLLETGLYKEPANSKKLLEEDQEKKINIISKRGKK